MKTEDEERREAPLIIDGKRLLNATQAADYLGVSRKTFYKRYVPHLTEQHLPNYARVYYLEDELNKFKSS